MTRWITVEDHPNYEVSNNGEVRNKRTGRILKGMVNPINGYLRVTLDGEKEYIHRLVGQAFFAGYGPRRRIKHLDDGKLKNSTTNLSFMG